MSVSVILLNLLNFGQQILLLMKLTKGKNLIRGISK